MVYIYTCIIMHTIIPKGHKTVMKHYFGKAVLIFIALFIAASTLFSCTDIPESTEEEMKTVLTVGDAEVPFEVYRYFFMNYKNEYDGGDDGYWENDEVDADAVYAVIREKTLSAIHLCYATFSLCEEYGIDPFGTEMDKIVDETVEYYIENEFDGKKAYVESLESVHMTDSVFRFIMRRFECDKQLNDKLIAAGVIKTDDDSVLNAIKDPDVFCRAKQVLIKNDEGEDIAVNLKKAKDALNAISVGTDFDRVVAQYGEDTEMIINPTGYYFTHNELIEEFEEAAFALEIGETSGIVESHVGYHIIQRCEVDASYVKENFDSLKESYLTWKYQEAVESEMEKLTVKEIDTELMLTLADFVK